MKPNGVVVAALAVAVWTGLASAQAPKRFIADAPNHTIKFYSGSGLNKEFSRNLATVNPDGSGVDPNVMRFDDPVHIAAIPVEPVEVTGGAGRILASGVDHDGTTPLLIYLDVPLHLLKVFAGSGPTLASSRNLRTFFAGPLTVAAQGPRALPDPPPGPTFFNLLSTIPWSVGAKALEPASAVVFHGAIIIAGPVYLGTTVTSHYELKGWGFAMSQDRGQTWDLMWDDTNQVQVQPYIGRGNAWCLRAAPVYDQRDAAHPSACIMCCTDYLYKDQFPQAESGRVFYFRITRGVEPTLPWLFGANTAGDARVKVFTLTSPIDPPPFKPLNHAHSCMATEWAPENSPPLTKGVQLLVSIGDGREYNRFIRFTLPYDYLSVDYTTAAWGVQDEYHGVADPAGGLNTVASESPQPVGAAFGANPGEMIWGTDLRTEWLFLTRLPTLGGTLPNQARFEHLYGLATGFGKDDGRSQPLVFTINQPRPELRTGPLTASYGEFLGAGAEPSADRILYCPNTSKPREWVQVAGEGATATVHAGHVYYVGSNLWRIPEPSLTPASAPTLMKIQPVLVAPGGKNLVKKDGGGCFYAENGSGPEFTALEQVSSTVWKDGDLELPPVPSLGNRALKIRTHRGDSSGFAGHIRLSSDTGTSWNTLPSPFGWVTQPTNFPQVRRFRGWFLDGTYDQTASISPNKTGQLHLRLWDGDAVDVPGARTEYSCRDRWVPCTNISLKSVDDGTGLGLRLYALASGDVGDKEENYSYLVISEALDGNGSLPYPMRPEDNGPDELLEITDLGISSEQSWSLKLAGMMPVANWDHYAGRGLWNQAIPGFESKRRWPLFTLWADDSNWVEFSANCESKGFLLRVRANGGNPTEHPFGDAKQIWLPDSPLLVAIGYSHIPTKKIYVGASLGGDLVKLGPNGISVEWSGKTFGELHFRGAPPGGVSGDGEVCEFRWIGGEIIPNSALTNATLLSAFADLGFLHVP